MPTLQLDPSKRYHMPAPISIVTIDGQFLAIARETGNWLLLRSERQLEIFQFLSAGHRVSDAFTAFAQDAGNDIVQVLTELEAKHYEDTAVQFPQSHGMYIYLTNRCNQRCRHCYMYAGEELTDELSAGEIQTLLTNFSEHGGEVVTFTGGEATLHPDFTDLVCFAKKVGLKVCVLSNGLLWTEKLIQAVKEYVDEVQISVDGFDAESYQQVRAVDTFDAALSAVDRLVCAGIRTIVAISPLLNTLLEHEQQYIAFAKSLITKYDGKPFFVKFNTDLMEGRNISPTEAENKLYRACATRIKDSCIPFSEEKSFASDHSGNTIFNNCGYGGLTVASNGDVFFCSLTAKCAKQANIRIESFESILEKSQRARQFSDINNLSPCSECPLKYLCGGGCRVKHFQKLAGTEIDSSKELPAFVRNTPCTQDQKDKFYRLMVKSNLLFYR